MKTYQTSVFRILVITFLVVLLPLITTSGIPTLMQETDANDIPFDTRQVVADYRVENVMVLIPCERETDANDIPFDTQIVLLHTCSKIIQLPHPWSLEKAFMTIASKPTRQKAGVGFPVILLNAFRLQPEPEVNDIPFDTRIIFESVMSHRKLAGKSTIEEQRGQEPGQLFDFLSGGGALLLVILILGMVAYLVYLSKTSRSG